jgi:hypothetical protein
MGVCFEWSVDKVDSIIRVKNGGAAFENREDRPLSFVVMQDVAVSTSMKGG